MAKVRKAWEERVKKYASTALTRAEQRSADELAAHYPVVWVDCMAIGVRLSIGRDVRAFVNPVSNALEVVGTWYLCGAEDPTWDVQAPESRQRVLWRHERRQRRISTVRGDRLREASTSVVSTYTRADRMAQQAEARCDAQRILEQVQRAFGPGDAEAAWRWIACDDDPTMEAIEMVRTGESRSIEAARNALLKRTSRLKTRIRHLVVG